MKIVNNNKSSIYQFIYFCSVLKKHKNSRTSSFVQKSKDFDWTTDKG